MTDSPIQLLQNLRRELGLRNTPPSIEESATSALEFQLR